MKIKRLPFLFRLLLLLVHPCFKGFKMAHKAGRGVIPDLSSLEMGADGDWANVPHAAFIALLAVAADLFCAEGMKTGDDNEALHKCALKTSIRSQIGEFMPATTDGKRDIVRLILRRFERKQLRGGQSRFRVHNRKRAIAIGLNLQNKFGSVKNLLQGKQEKDVE